MKKAWTRGEKLLWTAPLLFGVVVVATKFGPEATRRAMGEPQRWNTVQGTSLRSMALSRNGAVLAAGGAIYGKKSWKRGSGTIHLWNARTSAPLPSIPPVYTRDKRGFLNGSDVYALTFSPDAKQVGFSRVGQPWALYDVATRKPLWRFSSFISDAQFSPDGRFIALSSYTKIFIVAARDGRVRTQWKRSGPSNSKNLAWSPDGNMLASIGPYDEDDPIELHRTTDGKLLRRIKSENTTSVAFSPDGKSLVVASPPLEFKRETELDVWTPVRCFNATTGTMLWEVKASTFGGKHPNSAAMFCDAIFSPDGRTVAAYQHNEGRIFILNASTGAIESKLQIGGATPTNLFVPPALAFSPDGKRLFARGKSAVLVWDLE